MTPRIKAKSRRSRCAARDVRTKDYLDSSSAAGYNERVKPNLVHIGLIGLLLLLGACGNKGEVLHTFAFVAAESVSVLNQTRARYPVEFDSTSMGAFVKSINGIENTRTAYWLYFVNSSPAKVSADAFVPQIGDTISWRLVSGY